MVTLEVESKQRFEGNYEVPVVEGKI